MLQKRPVNFIKKIKSKGLFIMDNKKNTNKTEKYQEQIKEIFKEFATDELYDKWTDTFEIERVEGKQVIVTYHGTEDFKIFNIEFIFI